MKKLIILGSLVMGLTVSVNFNAAAQKKGLSKQGKGAIIGGAGGAVAGGLIGHNVGGALIGGAIGAGGGYVIGNEARKREEKRKHAAYMERRARWKGHTRVSLTHIDHKNRSFNCGFFMQFN